MPHWCRLPQNPRWGGRQCDDGWRDWLPDGHSGARFTDKTGEEVPPMGCGLSRVACINLDGLDERLREADVTVLCDVKSPLYGAQGAAFVFAPQKGALPKQVQTLDNALRAFAQTLLRYTGSDIRRPCGRGRSRRPCGRPVCNARRASGRPG